DADAWARLFGLYRPLVLHWCTALGVRPADAEDVAQDTFRAAAANIQRFRRDEPGASFRGWLRGITRNMALMHFRRCRGEVEASGGSAALWQLQQVPETLPEGDDDPAEQLS